MGDMTQFKTVPLEIFRCLCTDSNVENLKKENNSDELNVVCWPGPVPALLGLPAPVPGLRVMSEICRSSSPKLGPNAPWHSSLSLNLVFSFSWFAQNLGKGGLPEYQEALDDAFYLSFTSLNSLLVLVKRRQIMVTAAMVTTSHCPRKGWFYCLSLLPTFLLQCQCQSTTTLSLTQSLSEPNWNEQW